MKKLLAVLLIFSSAFFLTPSPAFAAGSIARDNSTQCAAGASAITITCTSFVLTSSNSIVIALVQHETTNNTEAITCTYNGVSMTKVFAANIQYGGGAGASMNEFYLAGQSGTHDLVCAGVANKIWVAASSYSGVNQSTPVDGAGVSANPTATSVSVSKTTTVNNDWLVGMCAGQTSGTLTASTNTSQVTTITGQATIIDTNAAQSPAGSYAMTCTGSSQKMGMGFIAIEPLATTVRFIPWQFWAY